MLDRFSATGYYLGILDFAKHWEVILGALPNQFSYVIMGALVPGATAESVAMAIASSPKFIHLVRSAMADDVPDHDAGWGPKYPMASNIRVKIARAFASATEIIDQ